jgi:hypothetical protein
MIKYTILIVVGHWSSHQSVFIHREKYRIEVFAVSFIFPRKKKICKSLTIALEI